MTERVSPTGRIHADIDDLFASEGDLGETLEEVARLGARLLLQSALEAEITEFLGRNRYQRRALAREARAGSRNGFAPITVKTTAGPITLERPKLRGTDQAFASRLLGAGVSGIECEYLFIDGSHFKMHAGAGAEPVLVAWGIDVIGKPHLLGLEPGSSESTDAWADFLRGMAGRGLRPPLLVISDGGPGLIAAVEVVLSGSLRQRCLIHRARNLLAKVPKHAQGKVKAEYWAIFDGIEAAPGDRAVAEATRRAKAFAAKWAKLYPAGVACLMEDLDHLTTYLRFPREHWRRIRHSNFIERTFGETRRRVKVIGRLPGERSCLSLVWAVLDRAGRGWRGVDMSPRAVRLLQDLRRELFGPPTQTEREEVIDEAVVPAA